MSMGTSMDMSSGSMSGDMDTTVQIHALSAVEFGLLLAMWAVMMVAMMLPTAVPMTLVYAAVVRKAARQSNPVAPTFVFVGGYLSVWAVFSVVATAVQDGLDGAALLSSRMASVSPILGGTVLLAAGVYELSPYKKVCLSHCRAPAQFIAARWRPGWLGAFRMGTYLGAYCVGCCWVLMALLFLGGVMNLLWVALISLFILLEKVLPFAEVGGRVVGLAMIAIGALVVADLVVVI